MSENSIRVAVKSPEYLPRLSYMALMQSVDVFVLADTFQYSRQSFQNRTRIRTPQGWHWISIPLLGRQHGRPICETIIDNRTHWRSKHLRAFSFNYSQSPYYDYLSDAMADIMQEEWEVLADLTCQSVKLIHSMLQMRCQLVTASSLPGCPASLDEILEVTEAKALVGELHELDNLPTGFAGHQFAFEEPVYRQHFEGFESNITAVDLICNYGPEAHYVIKQGIVM